jgi:hypothetical protein
MCIIKTPREPPDKTRRDPRPQPIVPMTPAPGIAQRRLANQQLVGAPAARARDVVARLGAVQAQDAAGARWGVGQRMQDATDALVERALDDGEIVRTHLLRPTWHLVAREDLRWMLALSGPRVQAGNAGRYRQLGLDAPTLARGHAVLVEALRDGASRTRVELTAAVNAAGIATADPQRMAYLLMHAELEGLICSGPRRGGQQSYALVDARVGPPDVPAPTREAALGELARRYFTTRGPATAHDFAWWSGLTVADARRGAALAGPSLVREALEGREHWGPADVPPADGGTRAHRAHLLPNYDEYFIGFRDRSAILQAVQGPMAIDRGQALSAHVVVLDGQVVAGWRRTLSARQVAVVVTPVVPLARADRAAVESAAERYGAFVERPAVVEWRVP